MEQSKQTIDNVNKDEEIQETEPSEDTTSNESEEESTKSQK